MSGTRKRSSYAPGRLLRRSGGVFLSYSHLYGLDGFPQPAKRYEQQFDGAFFRHCNYCHHPGLHLQGAVHGLCA